MWHDQEEWVGCWRCCFWDIGKNRVQIPLFYIALALSNSSLLCNQISNCNRVASKWSILKLWDSGVRKHKLNFSTSDSFPLIMSHKNLYLYGTFSLLLIAAKVLTLSTRQAWADDRIKVSKNIKILEFGDYIWNHNEKYIQMSTNMPGIGSLFREIDVKISEIWESSVSKTSARPRFKC